MRERIILEDKKPLQVSGSDLLRGESHQFMGVVVVERVLSETGQQAGNVAGQGPGHRNVGITEFLCSTGHFTPQESTRHFSLEPVKGLKEAVEWPFESIPIFNIFQYPIFQHSNILRNTVMGNRMLVLD